NGADFAGAVGPRLEPTGRRMEILAHLLAVHRAEIRGAGLLTAGIAAHAGQTVGGECHEVGRAKTPGDIFDIRIQTAVLVDYQDSGKFSGRIGGTHKVTFNAAIALWR